MLPSLTLLDLIFLFSILLSVLFMMQSSGSDNGSTLGSHPACASCKHQRKKCSEDCTLAPYFPAQKTREFQAVHRMFGVSNVQKLVRGVRQEDRPRLVDSLVWEAFCRQKDPVLGAYGEYKKVLEELRLSRSQIQMMQGAMAYKLPGMIGWNGTNGINSKGIGLGGVVLNKNNTNNAMSFSHENERSIVDSSSFGYLLPSVESPENMNHERDVGSVVFPLPQQQQQQQQQQRSINGLNQYHLSGQFGSIKGKMVDNTMWENRQ